MGESDGENQLPGRMRLKGKENYMSWKRIMEDLATCNGLLEFIHEKREAPPYADEFDEKTDEQKVLLWKAWASSGSSMQSTIQLNVNKRPAQLLVGYKTAREMWLTLQTQYEGTDVDAIEAYINFKYENYPDLLQFIIAFKQGIKRLNDLEIAPPESWYPIRFIRELSDAWPIWAERQRSNLRMEATRLTLLELMGEITDEARIKMRSHTEGMLYYRGKPSPYQKGKYKGKDRMT